ncbi:MAG: radical SAM protein [Clostridia bacterium]|nr:radical SAM protein [Clostridia bacterium]MBQ9993129.1 radical SAM protein [Clostridia bacterium]
MTKHANIAIFVPHNGCPHTCAFCNQRIISGEQSQPTPELVADTLSRAVSELSERAKCSELAFFGGSFTAIERGYMISLLEAAYPFVRRGDIAGIRCSTRPDCVDAEIIGILRRYGVTAVELGAQSMDDRVLRLNERGHTAQDVRRASALIKDAGISLGLQMMTGLYGDSDEGAEYTARELAALRPDTVRIYPTVVLRGTGLHELMQAGEYLPQGVDGAVELCSRLLPYFEQQGIAVIRLGLHASADIERDLVGGAYHPAMREMCEGRIFLRKMTAILENKGSKTASLHVNGRDISKAVGQKRCNIQALAELGYSVTVTPDDSVPRGEVRLVL